MESSSPVGGANTVVFKKNQEQIWHVFWDKWCLKAVFDNDVWTSGWSLFAGWLFDYSAELHSILDLYTLVMLQLFEYDFNNKPAEHGGNTPVLAS